MSELIGKELGLYQILEYISAGGMSTVYKAYHMALDRHVAVKVLPAQTGLEHELRQRFQQEVRVIARLQHAHILPIFDYGQDDGRLYLVMRLIEHGSLADRLRQSSMAMDQISRVIHQVGDALSYAHSQGIVHRDVKPSNVLIDGQGNCYLSDFGLAKTMQASIRFTATGVGLGTPAYMSPEQGKGEVVDARSDIYSLGAMLYEMVTGQVPYQADTPLAVMLKHITAPLPLPSRIRPDISPAMEQVIALALSKEPHQRFQTIADMVDAFDGAVLRDSMPIVVPPRPSSRPSSDLPLPKLGDQQPPARQNGGQTRLVLPTLTQEPETSAHYRFARPAWRLIGAALALLAVLVMATVLGTRVWSKQRATLRATETALIVTQVALERNLTATALALARPTSTPVPSATATQTLKSPTPTATQTATATATQTSPAVLAATATATATATASPTATPTPTPTATPTRRPPPTPTVRWLPAPAPLAPAEGAVFVGWNADVTLRWTAVDGLAIGEYYVVRIPYNDVGGVAEFWRQETSLRLPPNFSLHGVGFADRHYDWTVQVMLCHENCYKVWDDSVIKKGDPAGDESQPRLFYWQSDLSGKVPDTGPEPTPTRHVPGG